MIFPLLQEEEIIEIIEIIEIAEIVEDSSDYDILNDI
jgi:hypothetical protein